MSTFLRQATTAARAVSRSLSSTAVARKDLVQDLYLRELKAYKPTPVAKDAHVGNVKQYTLPPAPKAPALPADLAGELTAYDAAEPTAAEVTKPTSTSSEETITGADAYLSFLEQDLPKEEDHH
ncbi:hypothetical protein BDN71DRAFT_1437599 [Pleurotus eryngii]|uniref:Uncharacterized protein n=1 Tax=Pleurotus eryngii TaxID=5323 RepID=A0A9P6AAI7_PLEER|nr:hypothetical protein BDN71DRAFT_1437599 [Pleurotus eryngii]